MKISIVKFLFSIALALVLGFLCEIIAPEVEGRNWISLAVTSISMFAGLTPALGLSYSNAKRGASIKVFSWLFTVVLAISNILFSCFEYKIDIYCVVILLLVFIGWIIIYGMFSAKSSE